MINENDLKLLNDMHAKAIYENEKCNEFHFHVTKKATTLSFLFHGGLSLLLFYCAFSVSNNSAVEIKFNELFFSFVALSASLLSLYKNTDFKEQWQYDVIDFFTPLSTLKVVFSMASYFAFMLVGAFFSLDYFLNFNNTMEIVNQFIVFVFFTAFILSTGLFLFNHLPKALSSKETIDKTIEWASKTSESRKKLDESSKKIEQEFEEHIHDVFDIESLDNMIENKYYSLKDSFQKIKLCIAVENGFIDYNEYRIDFMKIKSNNKCITNT